MSVTASCQAQAQINPKSCVIMRDVMSGDAHYGGPYTRAAEEEHRHYREKERQHMPEEIDPAAYARKTNNNQDPRAGRGGSAAPRRRSHQTSPDVDERVRVSSANKQRPVYVNENNAERDYKRQVRKSPRQPETDFQDPPGQIRPSRRYDPNSGDPPGQIRPSRRYDSHAADSANHLRSRRAAPKPGDPPGQIRPSRKIEPDVESPSEQIRYHKQQDYNESSNVNKMSHQHQSDMARDSSNIPRSSSRQNNTSNDTGGQRRRSSLHFEAECNPPGQIRTTRRVRNSDESESATLSRRSSLSRSDSRGEYSPTSAKSYKRVSSRTPEQTVGDNNESRETGRDCYDSSRDIRKSQSRHGDLRRTASRSSSVDKTSDVDIDTRGRERRAPPNSRSRAREADTDAYYQGQGRVRSSSRSRGYEGRDTHDDPHRQVEKERYNSLRRRSSQREVAEPDASYSYRTNNQPNDGENAYSEHERRRHRKNSASVQDVTDSENVSYRRSSSRHNFSRENSTGSERNLSNQYRMYNNKHNVDSPSESRQIEDQGRRSNRTRRRSGNPEEGTLESRRRSGNPEDGNIESGSNSRYDLTFDLESSYSLTSQASRRSQRHQELPNSQKADVTPNATQNNETHGNRAHATYDRRNYKTGSSHRKPGARDDPEISTSGVSAGGKADICTSRRSSSSRSNHDTGFASSPSSPRRDDSQSRFSSDASPSRYGANDETGAQRSEGSRRRRTHMVSHNSLDVPGGSLRKEQSLSSSGRGDSSLDEPSTELYHSERISNKRNGSQKRSDVNDELSYEPVLDKRIDKEALLDETEQQNGGSVRTRDPVNHKTSYSTQTLNKDSYECTKAMSSSTSTLKSAPYTSKASFAGSISSLLGRNRDDGQQGKSFGDRWKRLKADLIADKEAGTLSANSRESAAALFSAAAAKLMSSMPSVAAAFPGANQPPAPPGTQLDPTLTNHHIKENGNGVSIPKSSEYEEATKPAPTASSPGSVAASNSSQNKSPSHPRSDGSVSSTHAPTVVSSQNARAGPMSARQSAASVSNLSVGGGCRGSTPQRHQASSGHMTPSHRPSAASTDLSTYEKRADIYTAMTESPEASETEDDESNGDMTPPPMDADMKRRSKEVDGELTSFLQQRVMSRREEKFHEAARVNDASAIRVLVREKVNVNCRNSLDRTALHWAAANGNLEAVEALVDAGADLEAKDKYGMRALLWSAWFGHIPCLKALVNAGASTRVANKQGLGVLHCAAENNHVNVIAFIFENLEPHDVNQIDKNERTPLHSAAEGGHAEAVNKLLECKADLHKKDKSGMTSVHLAAKHGNLEVLKALLLQGVEVDDRDVEGRSALHLAAEAGHKESVDLLLDYTANPNSETVKEVTPLHLAAIEGHVEVCKSLVKYGCNVNAQNFQGNTALHLSANANHKEVARVLVEGKCELDLPNTRMQTPLHVAVESGHLDVVQILLAGGASMETREKSGKSALQLAARGNYVAVVDMLIKAERYYAKTRDYHDKDVGYVDPDSYLRRAQHPLAAQMREVLWKLAQKQLKPPDWKKLAYHWGFTAEHVRAIEQEYTGTTSYKEHSFRLLNIWLHGVRKDENVIKLLFEALVSIDRKQLAESVRRKVNMTISMSSGEPEKPCAPAVCSVS